MKKIFIVYLMGLCLLPGCVFPKKIGNPDSARKVLIAGQTSEFKQNVIDKVRNTLESRGYYFEIAGSEKLNKEKTGEYGAILLVTGVMAGKIDNEVIRYLQEDPGNPKIILFYTNGGKNPVPPELVKLDIKVDAVTSASLFEQAGMKAGEIIAFIEERF